MKVSFTALLASATMAQSWTKFSYCDYSQFVVEEYTSSDVNYDSTTCFEWCLAKDAGAMGYTAGDDMCCDFEKWVDGTFNCYLYAGGKTVPQDMDDYPNDEFNSVIFPHLMPRETEATETIGA